MVLERSGSAKIITDPDDLKLMGPTDPEHQINTPLSFPSIADLDSDLHQSE
jgi:hypothetical protein